MRFFLPREKVNISGFFVDLSRKNSIIILRVKPAESRLLSAENTEDGRGAAVLREGVIMAFSSLFFLFLFLPVFLLVYYKVSGIQKKNIVLLAASLIFYCWGGIRYLLLLMAMTAVGWMGARQTQQCQEEKRRKFWTILSVVIFLAVLGIFKYTGFFLGTFGALFRLSPEVENFVLPLGISFYTFKLISYTVDVYRRKTEAQENYWLLLLYTSIFHQSVQGPIVRYTEMKEELTERRGGRAGFLEGMLRFCVGLGKKTILADHCGELAETFLPLGNAASAPAAGVWLGSLCYMLQIYLDFSAYSDMALGLGRMLGFHYPENFNYPYIAVSVKDFWKRWHISLSSFFRDYVYIPLGGSRCNVRRMTLNLLAVWALTGLWHGASWNYVLWGLYYFGFIVLENYWKRRGFQMGAALGRLYTLAVAFFGWIFFRFEDFQAMGQAFRGLLGLNGNGFGSAVIGLTLKNNIIFLLAALLAVTPVCKVVSDYASNYMRSRRINQGVLRGISIGAAALLLVISVMMMAGSSYTPFLYDQF